MDSFRTLSRLLHENRRRVALLSLAGLGVAGAAFYAHRQLSAIQNALNLERVEGARALKAAFQDNKRATFAALSALIPVLKEKLEAKCFSHAKRLVSRISDLKNGATERQVKRDLWHELKVVTFGQLATTAYIIATLHTVLTLQVNLLSRYSKADFDAPIELLPNGPLRASVKQDYLSIARFGILDESSVELIFEKMINAASPLLEDLSLKQKLTKQSTEALVARFLHTLRDDAADHWSTASLFEPNEEAVLDSDLELLLNESLDLSEALKIDSVVAAGAVKLIQQAMDRIPQRDWGDTGERPCAHLLGPLQRAANELLNEIPRQLSEEQFVSHFGAAVLLSGEKNGRQPSNCVTNADHVTGVTDWNLDD